MNAVNLALHTASILGHVTCQ